MRFSPSGGFHSQSKVVKRWFWRLLVITVGEKGEDFLITFFLERWPLKWWNSQESNTGEELRLRKEKEKIIIWTNGYRWLDINFNSVLQDSQS